MLLMPNLFPFQLCIYTLEPFFGFSMNMHFVERVHVQYRFVGFIEQQSCSPVRRLSPVLATGRHFLFYVPCVILSEQFGCSGDVTWSRATSPRRAAHPFMRCPTLLLPLLRKESNAFMTCLKQRILPKMLKMCWNFLLETLYVINV